MYQRRHRFTTSVSPALLAVLVGCATMIDEHTAPPADWPQLKRQELRVSFLETQRLCAPAIASMTPVALALSLGLVAQCVLIDFSRNTCTKVRPIDETDGDQHEEEHCQGRDHIGETNLRDAWAAYKGSK